jgi:hypothetical protein
VFPVPLLPLAFPRGFEMPYARTCAQSQRLWTNGSPTSPSNVSTSPTRTGSGSMRMPLVNARKLVAGLRVTVVIAAV